MKLNIASIAVLAALGLAVPVSADVNSNPWEDRDREAKMPGHSPDSVVYEISDIWAGRDREENMKGGGHMAEKKESAPKARASSPKKEKETKYVSYEKEPEPKSRRYSDKPVERKMYAPAAYDDDLTPDELASIERWQNGIKNVFWEDYRGNNVRVEVLRTNQDVKEMRLKFVQSQDMNSDPDGSVTAMLDNVADAVIKRTCGKASRQAIILYERPSVEVTKQTTYDDYRIVARGASLREYGFRCIY
ncbi:MAG: hypothetical protein LBL52_01630 [Rickettsiales bacterium]|jgi:hypothetical protein|nr:hypothetical protein [Rickettsiales bacterium]